MGALLALQRARMLAPSRPPPRLPAPDRRGGRAAGLRRPAHRPAPPLRGPLRPAGRRRAALRLARQRGDAAVRGDGAERPAERLEQRRVRGRRGRPAVRRAGHAGRDAPLRRLPVRQRVARTRSRWSSAPRRSSGPRSFSASRSRGAAGCSRPRPGPRAAWRSSGTPLAAATATRPKTSTSGSRQRPRTPTSATARSPPARSVRSTSASPGRGGPCGRRTRWARSTTLPCRSIRAAGGTSRGGRRTPSSSTSAPTISTAARPTAKAGRRAMRRSWRASARTTRTPRSTAPPAP